VVLVQADVQGEGDFLAAFSLADGRELWRTTRSDVPTWGSPTVVDDGSGREVVAVNGWHEIGGYDFKTGERGWLLKGGGDIPVPTPFEAHGLVYITNAHGRLSPIYAVRAGAAGDITPERNETASEGVAWADMRGGGYMITPIVIGDHLYVCKGNGVLTCYDAKTGEEVYKQRLGTGQTGFTASLVGTDEHLYVTSETGVVYVIKAGPEFEIVSENPMGGSCMASPAISGGVLFIRTIEHVVAVGASVN
jgi:outer membrane protein assembly factor BamB